MNAQIIDLAERRRQKLLDDLIAAWLEFNWRCWCAWWKCFGFENRRGGPQMK